MEILKKIIHSVDVSLLIILMIIEIYLIIRVGKRIRISKNKNECSQMKLYLYKIGVAICADLGMLIFSVTSVSANALWMVWSVFVLYAIVLVAIFFVIMAKISARKWKL